MNDKWEITLIAFFNKHSTFREVGEDMNARRYGHFEYQVFLNFTYIEIEFESSLKLIYLAHSYIG